MGASIQLLFVSLIVSHQVVTSQQETLHVFSSFNRHHEANTLNPRKTLKVDNISDVLDLASELESLSDLYAQLELLNSWTSLLEGIELPPNECTRQLGMFLDGLLAMDDWALRMFDASAKFQSGFLEGNVMQIGNYEECLKINIFVNETQLNGKYCTAIISTNENETLESYDKNNIAKLKLSYGFCMPSVCDEASITEVARLVEARLNSVIHFQFFEELCSSSVKAQTLPIGAILSIIFFALIGIIIVLSTLYDILIFSKKIGNNEPSLLVAFSFYINGKKLFSTKTSSDSLKCLNGMRVISIMWIIGGHRYMFAFMMPLTNLTSALKWEEYTEGTLITSSNLAVDTFFVISGLLIVYVYLNHKEKGQNMPTSMFYLHRILRLTPSLAMVVLFYTTLFSHVGSGPLWFVVYQYFQRPCERSWWWTLLYVQNYIHPDDDACVDHSWYLAVDTQLYFLSPLLLLPLIKWPKRTISVILLLVALSSVVTFGITWQRQLPPSFYGFDTDIKIYLYWVTHARAAPWLVGFILGYLIFRCKNRKIIIHKAVVLLLWLSSTTVMLIIVLYHSRMSTAVVVTLMQSALSNSLIRTIWSLAVSCIIFLCVTGYGGLINKILSCSIFTILIRVNYSMYLLHNVVVIYDLAQKKTPEHLSPIDLFYMYWGDLIITLLLSFLWTLAFESPILVLEKLIFGKRKKRDLVDTTPQILKYNINSAIFDNKIV